MGNFEEKVSQRRREFDANLSENDPSYGEYLESQGIEPGADFSGLEFPEEFHSRLVGRDQWSNQCAQMEALSDEYSSHGGNITNEQNHEIVVDCDIAANAYLEANPDQIDNQYNDYYQSLIDQGESPEGARELADSYFHSLMDEAIDSCVLQEGGYIVRDSTPGELGGAYKQYLDPETGEVVQVPLEDA